MNSPENVAISVRRRKSKSVVHVRIEFDILEDDDKKEIAGRLNKTVPWMLQHLYSWADFDECYSIKLFCDALHNLGKGLIQYNNTVNSQRYGRRAMQAAAQLRDAYDYRLSEDKSYINWTKSNPVTWTASNKGYCQLTRSYKISEEYAEKMYKIINERQLKVEEGRKEYAWAFIKKHIDKFWD